MDSWPASTRKHAPVPAIARKGGHERNAAQDRVGHGLQWALQAELRDRTEHIDGSDQHERAKQVGEPRILGRRIAHLREQPANESPWADEAIEAIQTTTATVNANGSSRNKPASQVEAIDSRLRLIMDAMLL